MDEVKIIDPNTEDVGILRTSTPDQRIDGDSPEIQRNKINYQAAKEGVEVGIWITFATPASGELETQPLLNVLPILRNYPTTKRVRVSIANRATRAKTEDFL